MSTATTSLECKFPDAYTGKQKKYWVEIQLLDEREDPIPNMPYRAENAATRSQCATYTGKSDASGIIRIEGLHPLELILHVEAKPLADEMEKRSLRDNGGRTENDSTVKPKATIEGYEYRYVKIGQLCDALPSMTPEWQDKENPPEYHFPDPRFSGQMIKKLNCRYVFEVCPFRAWSLILHHQTDYSIVNSYNLGIMADLSYCLEGEIIRYFEHTCIDLSSAPKLTDTHDYYAVVKDVPFSQRYVNTRFITTAGNIIKHDTQLFYVSNDEHVIVSWRGTAEVRDWLTDLTFAPHQCPGYLTSTGKIHHGFLDAFECAKNEARPNFDELMTLIREKVPFLCGHSLGGALALIYAAEIKSLKPLLYTYGMPRVFTADAMLQLSEITHYRHVNDSDTVTSVPPDVNLDNWFYDIYGPIGYLLGPVWSVAELFSQKITGVTVGDCFWHHGDIVLFYNTSQVVESLLCEGSMSAPKCRKIKYTLPKKTKYYLITSLAEDKNIAAKNQDMQFIRSLTPDSMRKFFPKNANPDLDSVGTNPFNHFMPSAYLPYINNQLVELASPVKEMKRKQNRSAFEKQMSDAGVPDNERERNMLFAALQRLVSETLKVTEQLPEGISALERFRKTEEEYDE
ncbi:lipase family protein [Scandinavium goeteborgense]|uniref:lipase family protein n=1 Tax=Scandinavium goeteborgense TaxID=1851514 RepID=UPI0038083557